MKTSLTLTPEAFVRNGPVFGTGRPFMYKVQGLPDSLSARIAEMHGRWQILVQRNHVGRWTRSTKIQKRLWSVSRKS